MEPAAGGVAGAEAGVTTAVAPEWPAGWMLSAVWTSSKRSVTVSQNLSELGRVPARRKGGATTAARSSTGCTCEGQAPGKCAYYSAQPKQLYAWDEAPPKLQFNPFIRTGYRAGLTHRQCLCSLLSLHNETGNVLTHLMPAVAMLALLATGAWAPWQGAEASFAWNVASIWLCFALSACYHTFSANHHVYDAWLKLDVCGVLLVLVGGGHVVIWWGLHCQPPLLRTGLVLAYYCAGAACIQAALRASSARQRVIPMAVLLLIRLGSLAVRQALTGHPSRALSYFAAMEACSLLGGLLNAARVPERWLPGRFDYWGNSHQIMHVLVAMAMLFLHLGATADHRTMAAIEAGALSCVTQ